MAFVETKDYKGGERRKNGKLRLSAWEYLRLIGFILTFTSIGTVMWVNLKNEVRTVCADEKKLEAKHEKDVVSINEQMNKNLETILKVVKAQADATQAQAISIGMMQTSMQHMQGDIKEIKENGR